MFFYASQLCVISDVAEITTCVPSLSEIIKFKQDLIKF